MLRSTRHAERSPLFVNAPALQARYSLPVMTSLPDVLKIELRIEVNGQPLLIQAQVQGEGEAAQRAAAELSSALTNVLNAVTKPGAADRPSLARGADEPVSLPAVNQIASTQPAAPPPTQSVAAKAAVTKPGAADWPSPARGADEPVSLPAANQIASTQPAAPPPTQSAAAKAEDTKHPLVALAQRYRVRINLGFGGLLLALAILAPIVAPAAQRREMLIVTLLLGLTAALMLFTAMLPGPERAAAPRASAQPRPAQPVSRAQVRKALLAQRRSPLSAGAGLALGVAFLLLGILAPFTLGATTADERFIIMIGFSPIAVIGGFLVYIFWRRAFSVSVSQPQPAHAIPGRRSPVTRAPQTASYRAVVPALLFGLAVFVIAVVVVVIYGTVSAALR